MPNPVLLNKLAKLAVKVGANVQKDQVVIVRASTENKEIAREVAKEAYVLGAKKVIMLWNDEYVSRLGLINQSLETLSTVPDYFIEQYKYFIKEGACLVSISSPIPGLNKDVDPEKMQKSGISLQKALSFFSQHTMGNKTQWTIIAAPNNVWAKQVYPNLSEEEAIEALWDAIFKVSRVTLENDPIKEWELHNKTLAKHNKILNEYNFKNLHFKNSLGTDLIVELITNHVWAGGGEIAANGVYFNPNIPTEETFTMPYKYGTQGKVVATKPLNYQGRLIDDFYLVFKDGKVVEYHAKKEEAALKNLLSTDDGSSYIGEIALISHNSPISNTNTLFINTLIDENASCHMALGRAYPMNIKNGNNTSLDELIKKGYNNSLVHSDFMFGSSDMTIIGTTQAGEKVLVFKDGNFVI